MKVELGISVASNVASASGCPQLIEMTCGIAYRSF